MNQDDCISHIRFGRGFSVASQLFQGAAAGENPVPLDLPAGMEKLRF